MFGLSRKVLGNCLFACWVGDGGRARFDCSRRRELRYTEKEVGFEQAFGAAQVSISRELRSNLSDAAFERGLLLLTRESYRRENRDKNYALRNAFFFGLGYSAPSEIAAELREKAERNPDLARSIADLGATSRGNISSHDWGTLRNLLGKKR